METYVIARKKEEENKVKILFFYEWMSGLPLWGESKSEAMEFSTKKEAKKHIPGLRHRKTIFGNHYQKGIKIIT